ncbi:poly-gamma-glutamate system protein [uncultured Cohaesibacter sp.]|uniref:poly-gamma-glutamate system protein n=1 Tax=uncultured Cohaesibacter sp. TaxID=1002546 RepID=UPI00292D73D7|nr:poly-gamma-glutamate system protein [uncultured Cohaesibacter sp.]
MTATDSQPKGLAGRLLLFLLPRPYSITLPQKTLGYLVAVATIASLLTGLFYVARSPWIPNETERQASQLMFQGLTILHAMRLENGEPINPEFDPAGTGLIGVEYSDITTSLGDLQAKQTSLNPSFAGLVVKWLEEAGVKSGDKIAVTLSGSFPALNMAVLCASEAMGLKPMIISSVGSSIYGANIYGFTWLDMEKRLNDEGLLHIRSTYASLGGIMDTHGGLFETGITEGEDAIKRNNVSYLHEGTFKMVEHDVERRMRLYFEEERPTAFVNVGGNVAAIGWINETHLLGNGLLRWFPPCDNPKRGLLFRMHEENVPVIHLLNVTRLAAANYLPVAPHEIQPSLDFTKARRHHIVGLLGLLIFWFLFASLALAVRKPIQ